MGDILIDYMNKVSNYFKEKHENQNKLTVKDVIDKILNKGGGDNSNNTLMNVNLNESTDKVREDLELMELFNNRTYNNESWLVCSERIITSHRKIIGKFIVFGKKIVRKFLRWYINPIVEDQNKFNGSVTRCINEIYNKFVVIENNFRQLNKINNDFNNNLKILKDEQYNIYEKCNTERSEIIQQIVNAETIKLSSRLANLEKSIIDVSQAIEEFKKENKNNMDAINEMRNEINLYKNKLIDLADNIVNINQTITELKKGNEHSVEAIYELRNVQEIKNDEIKNKYLELNSKIKEISEYYKALENNTIKIDKHLNDVRDKLESDLTYLNFKIKQLQKKRIGTQHESIIDVNDIHQNYMIDKETELDYFMFENRFRGTEKEIKNRNAVYLDYYKNSNNVLDIGCGRGEFLELLMENKIDAKGIDIYDDFVEYCKSKGLNVEKYDAVEYLFNLQDNSLGGIFLGQVIEHLEKNYLLKLIELSYKKLKPGSFFIAETPNPTMLTTFTNSFYLDLSHIKPIHPETMKFLLQYYGFKDVKIEYNENSKINYQLPLLNADEHIQNIKEFNDGLNLISSILFGYQDYAVIGRK